MSVCAKLIAGAICTKGKGVFEANFRINDVIRSVFEHSSRFIG